MRTEDPLESLIEKPLHTLTPSELEAFVRDVQERRMQSVNRDLESEDEVETEEQKELWGKF